MYSSGPFSAVLFARDSDGLRTFTTRGLRAQPTGMLVDHLVTVQDNRDFNQRFISTEFLPVVGRS